MAKTQRGPNDRPFQEESKEPLEIKKDKQNNETEKHPNETMSLLKPKEID